MTNYEYYMEGYNNTAHQLGYIPEFEGIDTIKAYSLGSIDGRTGNPKDIETFEAFFAGK